MKIPKIVVVEYIALLNFHLSICLFVGLVLLLGSARSTQASFHMHSLHGNHVELHTIHALFPANFILE